MTYARVVAVTGGNKGIGFAIVRNIALDYPKSSFNSGPLLIYLAARDRHRGEQAVSDFQADSQLKNARALKADGGLADVKYAQLDISSSDSINQFKTFIEREHPQGIDVLVNNAGVAIDGFDSNTVKDTLACNYYGTLNITKSLLPSIRDGGRVVNVSSMVGKLNNKYSQDLTTRFKSATEVSQITDLMSSFQKAVDAGTYSQDGWPNSAYAVSKTGVTGMSRILGQQTKDDRGILLNACCPGYVKTDMTKGGGRKTPDQGAKTPVKLAIGDIGHTSGEFWMDQEVNSW